MRNIRISIFMIVVTLICVGVVMVYSSSAILSYERYGSTTFFLRHHLFHLLIGVLVAALVMSLDLQLIRRWARPVFFLSLFLLVLIIFLNGWKLDFSEPRSWLPILLAVVLGLVFEISFFIMNKDRQYLLPFVS